jgi:hypothetical protein
MYGNKIKKNMAICLVGLHFLQNYKHHNDIIVNVNYKEYLNNIKTKIYSYFEKDFHVDTFVCTSMSNKLDELLNDYSVVKYCIEEDHNHIKKLKVLELLIDYISETNKQYDVVLMTRFDIYIIDEFTKDNINLDYFNVVSVLEQNCLMDDNLFIFPIEYLISIKNIIRDYINIKNDRSSIHWLLNELQKNVNINYIKNEPGSFVAKLSFFKLRYFDNLELIINRTLFTKNVIYNSNGNTCQIILEEENNVYLNKLISSTGTYCWFGYIIETPGKYNLSFDVYSNKDIIDYDYVKIHNPIKYYKTSNIYAYNWITIGITIEVSEANDKLIFIFDDFNDKIGINFKNILIRMVHYNAISKNIIYTIQKYQKMKKYIYIIMNVVITIEYISELIDNIIVIYDNFTNIRIHYKNFLITITNNPIIMSNRSFSNEIQNLYYTKKILIFIIYILYITYVWK